MQEKLARLHFSLDVYVEELVEDQKKTVADRNLDQLLTNVSVPSNCLLLFFKGPLAFLSSLEDPPVMKYCAEADSQRVDS